MSRRERFGKWRERIDLLEALNEPEEPEAPAEVVGPQEVGPWWEAEQRLVQRMSCTSALDDPWDVDDDTLKC